MTDIFALTQEALAGTDIELIDVERAPLGLLRVTIDRVEGVRIEDCEQVSRQLSRVFEVENIDYKRLEVGSPGVDRPLRTEADFQRFSGQRAEVRLREAVGSRRTFTGLLRTADDVEMPASSQGDAVFGLEIEAEGKGVEPQVLSFTLADVERAKLDPILDFKGKKR